MDSFSLPHTEELLQALSGLKFFFKDLHCSGVPPCDIMHQKSRPHVIIYKGLFRFKRMYFDLALAPAALQTMMSVILQGWYNVFCYIDAIIVHSATAEHRTPLLEVRRHIDWTRLRLNVKSIFNVR